jgi:hypothetical protein
MLGARRLAVLIGLLAKDRSLLEKVQGTLGDAGNLPAGRRSSPAPHAEEPNALAVDALQRDGE